MAELPFIDFSPLLGCSPQAADVAEAIRNACRETGSKKPGGPRNRRNSGLEPFAVRQVFVALL
jgi:hypothetical protein